MGLRGLSSCKAKRHAIASTATYAHDSGHPSHAERRAHTRQGADYFRHRRTALFVDFVGSGRPRETDVPDRCGVVLGTAEMLASLSSTLQPFRFVTIDEDYERRLQNLIQASIEQNRREQQSLIKERTW